ncbi:HNH endonuclease, partial [Xanthomonas citri pv. citri]|nr:HNH endonuclease [Xanthomonas citri pv. citri]
MYQPEVDQLKQLLDYDPETGVFRWKVRVAKKTQVADIAGSANGRYVTFRLRGRNYTGHRLAWLFSHGRWPSSQIDHINGVGTDNRLCNLRESTQAENMQNRAPNRNNSS